MHLPADSCGVVTPYEGVVRASDPPFFHASSCRAFAFSAEQAHACLAGRRVFIIGNSVGRGYAFELRAMLARAAAASREEQKEQCAKAPPEERDGHSQSCVFDAANVSVHYLWRQYLSEEPPWKPGGEGDFCTSTPIRECYGRFFEASREGDILIFQQGLVYARYFSFQQSEGAPMPPAAAAAMQRDAREFIGYVGELVRGGVGWAMLRNWRLDACLFVFLCLFTSWCRLHATCFIS